MSQRASDSTSSHTRRGRGRGRRPRTGNGARDPRNDGHDPHESRKARSSEFPDDELLIEDDSDADDMVEQINVMELKKREGYF